jgi:hypothetical protein
MVVPCGYENQTGFESGPVDRCACSDFGGYCFWLMTVPLSYDWVYAVVIGFIVSIGVFVIWLISSFIVIRLRRSCRASHALQIRPTI